MSNPAQDADVVVICEDVHGNTIFYTDELGAAAVRYNRDHNGPRSLEIRPRQNWCMAFFAGQGIAMLPEASIRAFNLILERWGHLHIGPGRPLDLLLQDEPSGPDFTVTETGRISAANPPMSAMPSSPEVIRHRTYDRPQPPARAFNVDAIRRRLQEVNRVQDQELFSQFLPDAEASIHDSVVYKVHKIDYEAVAWEGVRRACHTAMSCVATDDTVLAGRGQALLGQTPIEALAWSAQFMILPLLRQLAMPQAGNHVAWKPNMLYALVVQMAVICSHTPLRQALEGVYEALHRHYKGTPHEPFFPGGGVFRTDMTWDRPEPAPYRKIQKVDAATA